MVTTEEGKFCLDDGKEIYTKTWRPSGTLIAVVVFLHGFSDHCNRYDTLFKPLANNGILVHSFDQRGFGRSVTSKSDRGVTGPRSTYLTDIAAFIRSHLPSPAPLFLMGHSMGGQGTLFFAARGPADVRAQLAGYLSLAPWIQLSPSTQPGVVKLTAGRMAERIMPRFQMTTKLSPDFQSHDEKVNREWDEDPLCHDTGTLEQLGGCLDVADQLHSGRITIEDGDGVHVFLAHGLEDQCTSPDATKAFAERLKVKDKELKLYEGSYHCIHLEPWLKDQFAADITEWIKARLPAKDSQQASASKL